MSRKLPMVTILLSGLILWAVTAKAQETRPQQPSPPVNSEENSSRARKDSDDTFSTPELKVIPDSRPLAGAQNLTLGAIDFHHTLLLPSFGVSTQVGSANGSGQGGSSAVQSTTYLAGRLVLNRTSERAELAVNYLAGGTLSTSRDRGTSAIQDLSVSDTIHWKRWGVMLGDRFSYISESPFGYGGFGGLDFLGVGLGNGMGGSVGPSFRPDLLPNQTILRNRAPRISNAVIAQTDYQLSHRSSLTLVGSYGILKFIDAGFQDSKNYLLQAGYNYAMNSKDSISVLYKINTFRFSNTPVGISDHSIQLRYAKRIVSRLSLQVGGGPQVDILKAPLAGAGTRMDMTVSSALVYQFGHNTASLSFDRSLTGGSGVLLGAETNQIQARVGRTLTRNWDGAVGGGYSKNQALQQTTIANTLPPVAWYLTPTVTRHFGRSGNLTFAYSISRQSGISAGFNATTHLVSVEYSWGLRPIVIE